jgi:hypothetical protein
MPRILDPIQFVMIAMAGWMNQRQLQTIEYLREENRVLREQLGGRRVQFNDDQRRRLAAKAKGLGRKLLAEVATLVTPETLLAWHRKLIAQKYRMVAKLRAIKLELRHRMHEPVASVGEWLQRVTLGYYRYHAVPGNIDRLNVFAQRLRRRWRLILSRRSQRGRAMWDRLTPLFQAHTGFAFPST